MNQNILEIKKLDLKGKQTEDLFNLKVRKNSIHSILFQNEVCKNSLIKFFQGEIELEEAELIFNEKFVKEKKLKEADRKKVYLINKYSSVNPEKDPLGVFRFNEKGKSGSKSTVFPDMTIAENIFFGREPLKKFFIFKSIDNQKMITQTAELLKLFDLKISPNQKMKELSSLEKQLIELLKAVSLKVELLLIDQAVSELNEEEKAVFFKSMQLLKKMDITIINFTREIDEVFVVSDMVTILKNGQNKSTKKVSESEYNELALLLIGR